MGNDISSNNDDLSAESGNNADAGFSYRLLAHVLDKAFIFIVIIIFPRVPMLLTSWTLKLTADSPNIGLLMYLLVVPLFLTFYNTIFESSKMQGSPAKYLFKIKVTGMHYERLRFLKALVRNGSKFLSSLLLCFGYVMILSTKRKQGLHDIIAKTYVIRLEK